MSQIELGSKPFLKWAGGKTQMLAEIEKYVPTTYNKYIEPFVGAGAVFFHLNPETSILSDSNEELVITYKTLRDFPYELIEVLATHTNNEEYFYELRSKDPTSLNDIERAARLIYLNKTCFNGLYRVNRKGQFNTPFGHRKKPNICDVETLLNASRTLQNVIIKHMDFQETLTIHAEQGDLVFIDPPYEPVGEYSDFKRYTKEFFSREDQVRLKMEFDRLVEIGAYPILTNSDAEFILDLYNDYKIEIVETRRSISSNAKTRRGRDIIVIGNYE